MYTRSWNIFSLSSTVRPVSHERIRTAAEYFNNLTCLKWIDINDPEYNQTAVGHSSYVLFSSSRYVSYCPNTNRPRSDTVLMCYSAAVGMLYAVRVKVMCQIITRHRSDTVLIFYSAAVGMFYAVRVKVMCLIITWRQFDRFLYPNVSSKVMCQIITWLRTQFLFSIQQKQQNRYVAVYSTLMILFNE